MPIRWSVAGKSGAAAAVVHLPHGARIKAEPDALITMSGGVEVGACMDGGFVGGLLRSALGGESLFSQTLPASRSDGEVVLGATDVGDIELVRLQPHAPLLLSKGAFLAADEAVEVSTSTQRTVGGALFSGSGLFVLRASGQGTLALAAHGAIMSYTLEPGEVPSRTRTPALRSTPISACRRPPRAALSVLFVLPPPCHRPAAALPPPCRRPPCAALPRPAGARRRQRPPRRLDGRHLMNS